MPIMRGVDGINRTIIRQFRGVDGVNREIKTQLRGVDGVNRTVFDNSHKYLYARGRKHVPFNNGRVLWTHAPYNVTELASSISINIVGTERFNAIVWEAMDLTPYSKLVVEFRAVTPTPADAFFVTHVPSYTSDINSPYLWKQFGAYSAGTDNVKTFDISDYTGTKCLTICMYNYNYSGTRTVDIRNVYLVK